jgi:Icc-related predicted phosphoesterase
MKTVQMFGLILISIALGCAHGPSSEELAAQEAQATAKRTADLQAKADAEKSAAIEEDLFGPPKKFADLPFKFEFDCPAPLFDFTQPHSVFVGEQQFWIHGSLVEREGDEDKQEWRIGVLGAIKDATEPTQANLKKAAQIFKDKKVDFVIVNGDLADQFDDLNGVFDLLAENFSMPLFVFPGNVDPVGGFNQNFTRIQASHSNFFNMIWHRHVKWGKLHLFVLPGYHNKDFSQPGACIYRQKDVDVVSSLMKDSQNMNEIFVLASHGPPLGKGNYDLDFAAGGGNVGDENLKKLIEDYNIPVGIFSHILESGGNAKTDISKKSRQKFPMKGKVKSLYLNAGAASGMPWDLTSGKLSEGMAAVITIHATEGVDADLIQF